MWKTLTTLATLFSFCGCGGDSNISSGPTRVVDSVTIPANAWKPDKAVMTTDGIFIVNGMTIEENSSTKIPVGSSTTIEIHLPKLERKEFADGGAHASVSYLIFLSDGTPVTGNSTIAKEFKETKTGWIIKAELPAPQSPGDKWQIAAFAAKNRPIAYSAPLTLE